MPVNKQNVTEACRLWGMSSIFTLVAIGLTCIWMNSPNNSVLAIIIVFLILASFVLCLGFYHWFKAINEQ